MLTTRLKRASSLRRALPGRLSKKAESPFVLYQILPRLSTVFFGSLRDDKRGDMGLRPMPLLFFLWGSAPCPVGFCTGLRPVPCQQAFMGLRPIPCGVFTRDAVPPPANFSEEKLDKRLSFDFVWCEHGARWEGFICRGQGAPWDRYSEGGFGRRFSLYQHSMVSRTKVHAQPHPPQAVPLPRRGKAYCCLSFYCKDLLCTDCRF